jgi:hypothetical protein
MTFPQFYDFIYHNNDFIYHNNDLFIIIMTLFIVGINNLKYNCISVFNLLIYIIIYFKIFFLLYK